MTFPRSAPGFGGLNPPRCTELSRGRGDCGWHGEGHPPTKASAAAGLGVSGGAQWGTPTFLPPAKALLRFKAGCKGNERGAGAGEGGLGRGAQLCHLSESKIFVQSPLVLPRATPNRHFGGGGGTGKGSNNRPAKRGRIAQKPPQSPAGGCQHWVTGCLPVGTGARWR